MGKRQRSVGEDIYNEDCDDVPEIQKYFISSEIPEEYALVVSLDLPPVFFCLLNSLELIFIENF